MIKFDEAHASEFLRAAFDAARTAANISRGYYSGNFEIATKADMTPVTQADLECEQAIRRTILERFPEHGFYGEETGRTQEDAEYQWLVDPIDGTKGFIRQYPFFSTQIALMRDREIILGVSCGTMMDELAWAEKGQGAWLNGRRLAVSTVGDPDRAAVSTGNLKSLAKSDGWSRLAAIVASADRIRGYGDFYHYHLLAAGKSRRSSSRTSTFSILRRYRSSSSRLVASLPTSTARPWTSTRDPYWLRIRDCTIVTCRSCAASCTDVQRAAELTGSVCSGFASGHKQLTRAPGDGLHRCRIEFAEP